MLRYFILVSSIFMIVSCSVKLPVMKLYEEGNMPDNNTSFLKLPSSPRKIRKNEVICILRLETYDGTFIMRNNLDEWEYALRPGKHTFGFRMTAINDVRESVAPNVPVEQLRENSTERFDQSLNMQKGVHYFAEPICRNGQKHVKFIQENM